MTLQDICIFKYCEHWPLKEIHSASKNAEEDHVSDINLMNGWNNESKIKKDFIYKTNTYALLPSLFFSSRTML